MHKQNYISAFGKLAPSEQWKQDTLAKMRVAQCERDTGAQTAPALRAAEKPKAPARRFALPIAAAVALLVVPTLWYWTAFQPAKSSAPQAAMYSMEDGAAPSTAAAAAVPETEDAGAPRASLASMRRKKTRGLKVI